MTRFLLLAAVLLTAAADAADDAAEGVAHPKDGPEILAVHAVAADVLAVVIQDRTPLLHPQQAYVAQEGDQLVAGKDAKPIPHSRDGTVVDEPPLITLLRPPTPGAAPVDAGSLAGDGARRTVQRGEESVGTALDRSLLAEAAAWQVRKGDTAVPIAAVAVKLKPDSIAGKSALCRVYFTAVRQPGTYRIHVPGIGCSYPFPIAADAWLQAMRVSMRGLLAHRSGIELAPPLLPYRRPRPMHPADGFRPIPTPALGKGMASSVCRAIREMMKAGPLPAPMASAWGGYMDAGDWDRHTGHLAATALLLELYDSAPAFWRQQKLDLPAAEVANRIPDLLDEALWNIDFFIRLQDADGGVRGGIESTEHPLGTEASWQERLVLGVFAKDHQSSYLLAATAAPAGRQLAAIAPERSAQLLDAAKKAWSWAEAHGDESVARMQAERIGCGPWRQSTERAWAAAALLQALPEDPLAAADGRPRGVQPLGGAGFRRP